MSGTQEQIDASKQEEKEALEAFNAGFNAGFEGKTNEPLQSDEASNQDQSADSAAAAPEYAQVTKQELDDIKARLGEIDNLKTAHAKTSGSLGTLNQVIEQLRANNKPGAPVEITDDVVDGLKVQFGDELSAAVLATLKKVAPALRGNGQAIYPDQIREQAKAEAEATYSTKRTAELQQELAEEHPDWTTVRNTPEFKEWQEKLPSEVKTRLNTSNSVTFISNKLTEFKISLKKQQDTSAANALKQQQAAARGNARRETMHAAVQPRGDGGLPDGKSANDDFHAGFYGKKGKTS